MGSITGAHGDTGQFFCSTDGKGILEGLSTVTLGQLLVESFEDVDASQSVGIGLISSLGSEEELVEMSIEGFHGGVSMRLELSFDEI